MKYWCGQFESPPAKHPRLYPAKEESTTPHLEAFVIKTTVTFTDCKGIP